MSAICLMEIDSVSRMRMKVMGRRGGWEDHILCSTVLWLCHSMLELHIQSNSADYRFPQDASHKHSAELGGVIQ